MPPLDVSIFPSQTGSHTADTAYTFHCHSHGSQPPAELSWFNFQGTKIRDATSEVNIITFFTSFLQFILCMILDAELRVYDRLIVILINSEELLENVTFIKSQYKDYFVYMMPSFPLQPRSWDNYIACYLWTKFHLHLNRISALHRTE